MKRLILLVYLIFFSVFAIYGQDAEGNNLRPIEFYVTKQYNIFFQSGISKIDYTYCNNSEILYSMKEDIEASLKVHHMLPDSILIRSTASPDGKADQNAVLAQERAAYTKDILLAMFPDLGKSNFVIEYKEESWDGLKQILKSDKDFPQGENMLEIIESDLDELSKEEALRNCKEGWEHLVSNKLFALRTSSITLTLAYNGKMDEYVQKIYEMEISESQPTIKDTVNQQHIQETPLSKSKSIEDNRLSAYVKTNIPGLAAGIANAAVEFDFARHWSIVLPVYYCAWNYFKETIKFRALAVQPEIRFWPREDNQGFFTGIHFGYVQYNMAFDGNYRYQDHNGKSPALGGGVSVGYRTPISKNDRWHIEFSAGGGAYSRHYDRFYNVNNGKLADTYSDTYWGLDNASISISYRFGLKERRK